MHFIKKHTWFVYLVVLVEIRLIVECKRAQIARIDKLFNFKLPIKNKVANFGRLHNRILFLDNSGCDFLVH